MSDEWRDLRGEHVDWSDYDDLPAARDAAAPMPERLPGPRTTQPEIPEPFVLAFDPAEQQRRVIAESKAETLGGLVALLRSFLPKDPAPEEIADGD